jgi:cephalosporin hydroxylase
MGLDRHDLFPHIEDAQTMTLREWLYFHNVMHRHYTHYLGRKVLKPPFDWIVMQDIIHDTKPDVIVEIGSFEGGFALWMAHLLDAMGSDAKIVGVDIDDRPTAVEHPRIEWVIGDATAPETVERVAEACGDRRGLVIEDSDHKYHVTKQLLEAYHRFVAPGCYLVAEDTIVEVLKLPPFPGPIEAVKEFAEAHADEFTIDRTREKYVLTYNPMGYLLRTGDAAAA